MSKPVELPFPDWELESEFFQIQSHILREVWVPIAEADDYKAAAAKLADTRRRNPTGQYRMGRTRVEILKEERND